MMQKAINIIKFCSVALCLETTAGFMLYVSKPGQQIGFPKERQVVEELYFYYTAFA